MDHNRRELHSRSNSSHISFPFIYFGPIISIVEYNDSSKNIDKLHPIEIGKIFYKIFIEINAISIVGSRIMITFESTANANLFLSSPFLTSHGLKASVRTMLLFCYGIIKLGISIS